MNDKKKLNIVFFLAWFPVKSNLLAGKFFLEHAKALRTQVNISIICIEADSNLKQWFDFSHNTIEGFELVKFSFRKIKNKFLFPLNAISYGLAIIYLLLKEQRRYKQADVNHVHVLTRTALLPYLIKLFNGVPYVISEHWSRYLPERNTYKGRFRKWLTKKIVNNSKGISAVTYNLKEAMEQHGLVHHNFQIIPNVVDTGIYTLAQEKKQAKPEFIFLHVSGLNDRIKNVSGLLRAFKKVLNKEQRVRLIIVGDDQIERPVLEQYSIDLGLVDYVSFKGKKYGADLVKEYQNADAFVMFSYFETQSCTILEAMACGLPIVSSNVGGINETVNDECGILMEAKKEDELCKSILHMVAKYEDFDKQHISNYVRDTYGYEVVREKLLQFYSIALDSK